MTSVDITWLLLTSRDFYWHHVTPADITMPWSVIIQTCIHPTEADTFHGFRMLHGSRTRSGSAILDCIYRWSMTCDCDAAIFNHDWNWLSVSFDITSYPLRWRHQRQRQQQGQGGTAGGNRGASVAAAGLQQPADCNKCNNLEAAAMSASGTYASHQRSFRSSDRLSTLARSIQ